GPMGVAFSFYRSPGLEGRPVVSLSPGLQNRPRRFAGQRRTAHGSPRRQTTFRPRLEVLEGRDVPSTLMVTNNLDSIYNPSPGSLRYEINAAQSGDTIVFSQSLKGQTIALGETLDIEKSLTIQGLGAKNLAVSGQTKWRVFEVGYSAYQHNVQVTLSGMTIENGDASGSDANAIDGTRAGGGILNYGTLTVSGCTLTGNSAGGGGGGIANELGGTMTISGCTVSRNFSNTQGRVGGFGGGGIYNNGAMTLSGSTVTQNDGGGIFNDYSGVLTILSSYVKSNHYGGDLVNRGTYTVDSSSTIG